MIAERTTKCPGQEILTDFVLGKLSQSDLEACESHLAECQPCVETMQSIEPRDTLHDITKQLSENRALTPGDESIVDNLIHRMKDFTGDASGALGIGHPVANDNRAAEVTRLLQPDEAEGVIGRFGNYVVQDLLGVGSTGVVFRALDPDLQRTVALKILRPSLGEAAKDRFVAEARATAAIDHPNVIPIYQVGTINDVAFIAMQWQPGETLDERLKSSKSLPESEVKNLGHQVAAGLAAAHQQGLIHRDIKPANIWIVDETNQVKILDFGLVRITDEDPQLTCTGMIAGTPCYMSPEQSRGAELDSRSDLFSLGCVLYQSITGILPFESANALSTLQAIQRDQPNTPTELDPTVSEDFSDLVMGLLEKSRTKRPHHSAAVADALVNPRSNWAFQTNHYQRPALVNQETKPGKEESSSRFWRNAAVLVALAFFGFGSFMFGPQIIRIAMDQGQIVIETNDQEVKIDIRQDGRSIEVVDLATQQKVTVKSGEYELRPVGNENSVSIDRSKLTLKRGDKVIVTINRISSPAGSTQNDGPAEVRSSGFEMRPENPLAKSGPYRIRSGDTLAVYIPQVLGDFDKPPVNTPPVGAGLRPTIGYPIAVGEDGTVSLPLVDRIDLSGMTIREAQERIFETYTAGDQPILRDEAWISVMLMQSRDYRAPDAFREGKAESPEMELAKLDNELQQAKQRYGKEHPKVRAIQQQRDYWNRYVGDQSRYRKERSNSEKIASLAESIRRQEELVADLEVNLIVSSNKLRVAETELQAYLEGEYPIEKNRIQELIQTESVKLDEYESELARGQKLYDANTISKSELSAAKSMVLQVESRLASARQQLEVLEKVTKKKEVILRESSIETCKAQIGSDQAKLKTAVKRLDDLKQQRDELVAEKGQLKQGTVR